MQNKPPENELVSSSAFRAEETEDHQNMINAPYILASNAPSPGPMPASSQTERLAASPSTVDLTAPGSSYTITAEQHATICNIVQAALPACDDHPQLPSRFGMSRYLKGYFNGLHRHFPFLHRPTFKLQDASAALIVNLLAVGAHYVFERSVASRLQRLWKTLRKCKSRQIAESPPSRPENRTLVQLEEAQALLLIMVYMTWSPEEGFLQEALGYQSQLANVGRQVFGCEGTLTCYVDGEKDRSQGRGEGRSIRAN